MITSSVVNRPSSVGRSRCFAPANSSPFPPTRCTASAPSCGTPPRSAKLYAAKLRALDKAIPVLLADPADVTLVARDLPPAALRIAAAFLARSAHTRRAPSRSRARRGHGGRRHRRRARARPRPRPCPDPSGGRAAWRPPAPTSPASPARSRRKRWRPSSASAIALILDGGRCPAASPSTILDLTQLAATLSFAPGRSAWSRFSTFCADECELQPSLCYNWPMLIGIDASRARRSPGAPAPRPTRAT